MVWRFVAMWYMSASVQSLRRRRMCSFRAFMVGREDWRMCSFDMVRCAFQSPWINTSASGYASRIARVSFVKALKRLASSSGLYRPDETGLIYTVAMNTFVCCGPLLLAETHIASYGRASSSRHSGVVCGLGRLVHWHAFDSKVSSTRRLTPPQCWWHGPSMQLTFLPSLV